MTQGMNRRIKAVAMAFLVMLIVAEQSSRAEDAPRIIAVMGFSDTSADKQAEGFNRALQEMLTTDLSTSRDVRVVERTQLEEVLQELKLGKTEFLDQASAARVGKGLGAQAILTGSLWIRDGTMRIDARLVHVETGEIILPEKIVGAADSFLDLEKELATKIVETLGARLSAFEKASLSRRHTTDFKAALAFGQALEAEDAGNAALARERAAAALRLDPDFAMAEAVVKDIDSLLDAARAADLRVLIDFLSGFELKLLSWPLRESPQLLPRYRELVKEGNFQRALVFWLENTEETLVGPFLKQPISMIFSDPAAIDTDRGPGWGYLTAGAGEVINFWCDLAQSDPDRVPRRPLTKGDLRPGAFVWLLPDVYTKRFAAAVYCSGDIATASQIAKDYAEKCDAMGPDATLYPQLEQLRSQLADRDGRQRLQQKRREYQMRWSMVESEILDLHMYSQIVAFSPPARKEPPTLEQARLEFVSELLPRLRHLPDHEQRRFATLMISEAVEAVAPADFFTLPLTRDGDVRMAHVAGCPTVADEDLLATAKPLQSADECTATGVLPCGTCRPLRWVAANRAGKHLAEAGSALLDKALATRGNEWPGGLDELLTQFVEIPTGALRGRLVELAKAMAVADGEYCCDRTRQKLVFQCVAAVADESDVEWLDCIARETPFFDVRASVGSVLGSIGSPGAAEALQRAIAREPLYFVRHSLVASLIRTLGSQYEKRVNVALSLCEGGQADDGITALMALVQEVDASPLPTAAKQRVLGALYHALGDAKLSARRPRGDAIADFRRAVELIPGGHPGLPPALNSLAYALALQREDLAGAEAAIRQALEIQRKSSEDDPSLDDTAMLDTLALVLFERGKLDEAREVSSRCVERPTGQSLEIHEHWGDILWALNDRDAARKAWKHGLSLATDDADDAERAERVRQKMAR